MLLLNNNDLYTCYAIRADCILSFGCYGTRQQISIGQFGASRNHKEALIYIYLSENIGGNIYVYSDDDGIDVYRHASYNVA